MSKLSLICTNCGKPSSLHIAPEFNCPEDEFVWTDELVKEFVAGAIKVQDSVPHDISITRGMLHFKKAKSKPSTPPKEPMKDKDWEILTCFDNKKEVANPKGWHDYYPREGVGRISNCDDSKCKIRSVLRNCDGEIFTIGDEVKINKKDEPKDWWGKITEFWLTDGVQDLNIPIKMHICYNSHHYDINYFIKRNTYITSTPTQATDKERMEIERINGSVWQNNKPNMIMCSLKEGQFYDEERFPAIKEAIEKIINQ